MMTGQSYVLDPEFRKAYDGTYESIQLLLDPMVMHKQQFEHDSHAQHGVLMMATQESRGGLKYILENSHMKDGLATWF